MRKFNKFIGAILLFLAISAFSITHVKAANYSFEEKYRNPETGYIVAVCDEADCFSEAELRQLAEIMETSTAYGNIALYTTERNPFYSTASLGDDICSYFGYSSTTVFIIDFDEREIYLRSSGQNERRMTAAKASTIADNTYRYATDGEYYTCAYVVFEQVNRVLDGARIAQPMKYISNALLAVMLALLINYFIVKATSANRKMGETELFKNLSRAYLRFDNFDVRHTHTDKKYSPQSSSSGGGGGGGGGGHSSGGGHSF